MGPGVSLPMPRESQMLANGMPQPPQFWTDIGYLPGVRLVPQEFLLGSYPFVSCSQPGDRAHRCFRGRSATESASDFIVSIPLLGSIPQNMAQAILDRFLLESLGTLRSLGSAPSYEQELRSICADVDISRCLVGQDGAAAA